MIERIDNIELDKDNVEFNYVAEFVRHTDKVVYLTGKAGTGKTTFLKYIKETTSKNTVIVAPTGVAAMNAGGVTIHSFFQIPFGPFIPGDTRLRTTAAGNEETIYTTFKYQKDKRKIIENLELLIIDEISMVRADLLDVIDRILKIFRQKPFLPFGGVQVILIGDTFQLPPVKNDEQWQILSQFYKSPFFFNSKVIENITPVYIELKKIYRQNEQEFIDLLNRVRVSKMDANDFNLLNSKYDPNFSGDGKDYIILATHNITVNETNLKKLKELKTELFTYEATVTGSFPDKSKPTDHYLKLKVGAQIMFVKNDAASSKRYYNGKIGKIKELEESSITVEFDDDTEVQVEKAVWENIQYTYDREQKKIVEEVIGTFRQFPIRLAWAITVHKSQGLTFEKVIADLDRAFEAGQVYVALSRCTSFSGLVMKSKIAAKTVKTKPEVIEFALNETPGTLLTKELNTGKADFYYKKAREDFGKGYINSSFDFFKKALKFRNDIDTDIFKKYIKTQYNRLLSFKETTYSLREQLKLNEEKLLEAKENIESQSQEKIELLSTKKAKFEKETTRLKKKLKQLEGKLSDAVIHSDELVKRLNSTESELSEKAFEDQKNRSEVKRLKKELQQLESKLSETKTHTSELEHKLNIAECNLKEKSQKNQTNNVEANRLKKQLRILEQKLSTSENNSKTLEEKLNKTESYLREINLENQANHAEIERLKNLKWYEKLMGEK